MKGARRASAHGDRLVTTVAIGAAGAALAQLAYARAVEALTRYAIARLRAGKTTPLRWMLARDVHFAFPGTSSWAADFRSRDAAARWLDRFVRVGFALQVHEVAVAGPPWRTTVSVRFTDQYFAPDGKRVYANDGVILCRTAWGRIQMYLVFEDTERGAVFEEWLKQARPELFPA